VFVGKPLAFLTEVGLNASSHPQLVAQLDRVISFSFAEVSGQLSSKWLAWSPESFASLPLTL